MNTIMSSLAEIHWINENPELHSYAQAGLQDAVGDKMQWTDRPGEAEAARKAYPSNKVGVLVYRVPANDLSNMEYFYDGYSTAQVREWADLARDEVKAGGGNKSINQFGWAVSYEDGYLFRP